MTEEEIDKFLEIVNPKGSRAKIDYQDSLRRTDLEDIPSSPQVWDVLFFWCYTGQGEDFWSRAFLNSKSQEAKEAKVYLQTVVARVRGVDKKEEDFL